MTFLQNTLVYLIIKIKWIFCRILSLRFFVMKRIFILIVHFRLTNIIFCLFSFISLYKLRISIYLLLFYFIIVLFLIVWSFVFNLCITFKVLKSFIFLILMKILRIFWLILFFFIGLFSLDLFYIIFNIF